MDEHPSCSRREDSAECQHEGWHHAESLDEILDALELERSIPDYPPIYDADGDRVLNAIVDPDPRSGENLEIYYQSDNEDASPSYTVWADEGRGDGPAYILIPEYIRPVTEEELAEVYKILGVE